MHEVTQALINIKRTTSGPDYFPYWLFRDFGYYLVPVITDLFNAPLLKHTVPLLWKEANIRPVPKEQPFTSCNQLRPISLTNIIMRLFERLVYRNELSIVCDNHIDLDQFAYRKGHNSTMALLKSQHNWLKWLDGMWTLCGSSHLISARRLIQCLTVFWLVSLGMWISIHIF